MWYCIRASVGIQSPCTEVGRGLPDVRFHPRFHPSGQVPGSGRSKALEVLVSAASTSYVEGMGCFSLCIGLAYL